MVFAQDQDAAKRTPSNQLLPMTAQAGASRLPTTKNVRCKTYGQSHLHHVFTTFAKDAHTTSYPYVDASGNTVDLASDDVHTTAQVCHYVMLHSAESITIGNPNHKK